MPTALLDTSVSVAHQHLVGSPTWWLMEPLKKVLENSFDSFVAGKTLTSLSVYGAGFDEPAVKETYHGKMSVARPMG